MDVRVQVDAGAVEVAEQDDLKRLQVSVLGVADPGRLDALLGELGTVDGEHVWLDVDRLRERGRPEDPNWFGSFAVMIEYARRHGWTKAGGSQVRAHVVWS